jgi:hypothetical protein
MTKYWRNFGDRELYIFSRCILEEAGNSLPGDADTKYLSHLASQYLGDQYCEVVHSTDDYFIVESHDSQAGLVLNIVSSSSYRMDSIEVSGFNMENRKFMVYYDDSDEVHLIDGKHIVNDESWGAHIVFALTRLEIEETTHVDNLTQQITITRVR